MSTKLAKFDLQQGFNRETTQYSEEGKWYDGNRVRFRAGKPENMRGYATKVSTAFDGSARDLIAWKGMDNKKRSIFATPDKVYVHDQDRLTDITPIAVTAVESNCFGTSTGSTRVCCSSGTHNKAIGDYVLFTNAATTIGSNIVLNNNVYPITSIINTNSFTISVTDAAAATSSTSGGANFNYYIATGTSVATQGVGYGAAPYNAASPTSVGLSKITATGGSALVTVSCASAHGAVANDFVVFQNTSADSVAATIGGNINLTKEFTKTAPVTLSNVFGTTVGDTRVCCSNNSHGKSTNDLVTFATVGATIGGNIVLSGKTFPITSVIDTNSFTISVTDAAAATSTQTGGSATFIYDVKTGGPQFTVVSVASTQIIVSAAVNASASEDVTSNINMTALIYTQTDGGGTGRPWDTAASSDTTNLALDIDQWSMDNWGTDIVLNRRGSNIFYFDTAASVSPTRATSVPTSPVSVNSIIVSPNDRHLVALGVNQYDVAAAVSGAFNPMLVRWSDQDDRTNWVPSVSSTSGEVVLTDGTKIIGSQRSKNAINIWTDNALWLMSYAGPPFTFKFQQAGTNCGLAGPHAAIDYNGVTYWMGFDNFYAFTGQVEVLDCTVRRYIFDRLNTTYYDKVYTGINTEFKEIIWLYVSTNGTECDSYVIFSPEEKYWVYGNTFFTTFKDREVYGNTITTGATTTGNYIYNNEPTGVFTGDGSTLTSFVESGDFDVDDGNAVMFMNRIIPDFDLTSGKKIKLSVETKEYPESTSVVTKEFDIYDTTQKVDFRARGRQAKVRVSCGGELGNDASWRWGTIRLALQGDGGR